MSTAGPKKRRSPNAPGIPLQQAVEKAQILLDKQGTHSAAREVIFGHWGYGEKSSSGLVAMGAVRAFGLLEKRRANGFALSELALMTLNPDPERQRGALQTAALLPKIHREIWEEIGGALPPSDDSLRFDLRTNRGFTAGGADSFIKQFRATLAFAGLQEGGTLSSSGGEREEAQEADPKVSPGGRERVPPLVSQRQRIDPDLPRKILAHHLREAQGVIQDTLTLEEGQVVLQWPSTISPENYEDLKDWLDLMARRIKKAVRNAEDSSSEK